MCRIYGALGTRNFEEQVIKCAYRSMLNGGPDQQLYCAGEGWLIGTNRLAIQGLKGGRQPFQYANGIHVVFNGEIYNHRDLRNQLIRKGHTFADDCDGNIIGPLYETYGLEFISLLDGMFTIAIIDLRAKPLLQIYTDQIAIKSIYYWWNEHDKSLIFASELEALQILVRQNLNIDTSTVYDYLSLRSVCGEKTIFQHVYTLGPSRVLTFQTGETFSVQNYLSGIKAPEPANELELSGTQLKQLLTSELEQMTQSEVPICTVISGGLDSTLISALASSYIANLHSFHISYKGEWPDDEKHFAQEAADFLGTNHHNIILDPDDLPDLILQVAARIGQPNTAPHSTSTLALFDAIHQQGFRVALTGEGADELFAGYSRFSLAFDSSDSWIKDYLDKFGPFKSGLLPDILASDFLKTINRAESTIGRFEKQILQAQPGPDRLDALQALDQWERFPYYILRRVDHLSMANSVEVRVPFCQPAIIDFARKLPAGHRISKNLNKAIVYEAARNLVPSSILKRPKQPFTLPINAMINKGSKLHSFMMGVFSDQAFRERGYFNHDYILKKCATHVDYPENNMANMLWSVLQFEIWNRHIDSLKK